MKNIVLLFITISTLGIEYTYGQSHNIISVYTTRLDADEEDKTMKSLSKFINEDQTYLKVINANLPKLIEKLNNFISINPSDEFLDETYYKFLLDEYEPAPENVKFTLTGLSLNRNDDLVLKTDYRLSEHQAHNVGNYLAIGTGRPFNNDEAIDLLINKQTDIDAFIILQFSPSLSFVGNDWGVGNSGASYSLRMKILNRKNKIIFREGARAGSAGLKFSVSGNKEPDFEKVYAAFEQSFNQLIKKLSKWEKKLSKVKY